MFYADTVGPPQVLALRGGEAFAPGPPDGL